MPAAVAEEACARSDLPSRRSPSHTEVFGAELRAASLLLFIASGVLLLLCMYFACVDPSLHASRSLKGAVEGQVRSGLRQ